MRQILPRGQESRQTFPRTLESTSANATEVSDQVPSPGEAAASPPVVLVAVAAAVEIIETAADSTLSRPNDAAVLGEYASAPLGSTRLRTYGTFWHDEQPRASNQNPVPYKLLQHLQTT